MTTQRTRRYRILTEDRRIKFTGTAEGSFFTLERAKELVNHELGEMIFEYDADGNKLWEVL